MHLFSEVTSGCPITLKTGKVVVPLQKNDYIAGQAVSYFGCYEIGEHHI